MPAGSTIQTQILFQGETGEMYAYTVLSVTGLTTGDNTVPYPAAITKTPIDGRISTDPGALDLLIKSLGATSMVVNSAGGAGSGTATVFLLVPASG